jgi:small subunit ribosomal protein S1
VEKLLDESGSFEGTVDGFNKGGLIVPIFGLRGFVPASQLGITRRMTVTGDTPDARYAKMIGEQITVRVVEVDRKRRRLILSERAASSETRQSIKERVIESLEEGKVYTGKVTSVADFGAFVNINGADGLVHLSEISWERVTHPSEVLEVGQEVQVKIINIDHEKKRIGLSIRALENDPWQEKVEKFKVGQLVEGVITRLTKFGAFARLEGDLEGLIHISEISESRIEHPKEKLHDGEVLTLRIIRIEPDQRRIGLSLRKVDSGAYKDLDFKQIDLEGVTLTSEEEEPNDLESAIHESEEEEQKGAESVTPEGEKEEQKEPENAASEDEKEEQKEPESAAPEDEKEEQKEPESATAEDEKEEQKEPEIVTPEGEGKEQVDPEGTLPEGEEEKE